MTDIITLSVQQPGVYQKELENYVLDAREARDTAASAAQSAISLAYNLNEVWCSPAPTDPTHNLNGKPVGFGSLYFNTMFETLKFYNGSKWIVYDPVTSLVDVHSGDIVQPIIDFSDSEALATKALPSAQTYIRVNGFIYRRVLAEPAHDGKVQSVGAWWEIAEAERRPEMAAAVGDAVTDDSAAFVRLESFSRGQPVDLGGRAFALAEVPTAARYFNGAFKVGSEVVGAAAAAKRHPFVGVATVVASYPGTFWPAGVWFDASTHNLWRAEVVSERHDTSSGSRLDVMQSRDMGETWTGRCTIFSNPDHPRVRAGALGAMSAGRWGGVVTTGDTTRRQWFVYSDDFGTTWVTTDITAQLLASNHFVYGLLMPGPSRAAGDWMVASYGGTTSCKIIRTTDNGASWSDATLKTATGLPGTSPNPTEPSIVYVPSKGWLMFTRVGTTPQSTQNLFVAKSADFSTWSGWIDTGVPLGENPVHALYDGGNLHVLIAQRTGFVGTSRNNILYAYSGEARALYDNPAALGAMAPEQIVALPARAIGYLQSCRLMRSPNDKHAPWYHFLKSEGDSSTLRPTRSQVIAIRDLPGAALGPQAREGVIQLVDNPIFSEWPRGTSFSYSASDGGLAGRFYSIRSGATLLVDRVTLSDAQTARFPFRPLYGMRVRNPGTPDDYVSIGQRWEGADALRALRALQSGGDYVCRLYGMGDFPTGLVASILVNGTSVAVGTFSPVAADATASWVSEAVIGSTAIPASISAVTNVRLTIGNGATVSEFDFTIVGCFLYPAAHAAAMEFGAPDNTPDRVGFYCQKLSGTGLRVGRGVIKSATAAQVYLELNMMMAPTVTVTGNWVIEGVADYTPSAIIASAGYKQAVISATMAGASTGFATLRATDADASILLDSGY